MTDNPRQVEAPVVGTGEYFTDPLTGQVYRSRGEKYRNANPLDEAALIRWQEVMKEEESDDSG